MKKRRTYTAEFKRQALQLAQDIGPQRAARDLEVSPSALYRWRIQEREQGEKAFPGQGNQILTPEEQELRRLRRENEILRQEREILKKAATFFMEESR